jgi:branched-subunit amino acid aminotransferase/4-amino-4-deoxychorismate lyase
VREELIRDAVGWRLCILKEEYDRLQRAIKDMEMPFLSVNDFIDEQIRSLLEEYAEWTRQRGI